MKWGGERPFTEALSRFHSRRGQQNPAVMVKQEVWEERRERQDADRAHLQEAASLVIAQTQAIEALALEKEELPVFTLQVAFSLTQHVVTHKYEFPMSYAFNLRLTEAFPMDWKNLYPSSLDADTLSALRSLSYAGNHVAEHALQGMNQQRGRKVSRALRDILDQKPKAREQLQNLLSDVSPIDISPTPDNPTNYFRIDKREIAQHRVSDLPTL